MLKVECESCKAPYQVDERRVPATGLKMRCPKCGHTFVVASPQAGAAGSAQPAAPAAPKPPPVPKKTMVGVGIPQMPAAAPAPPARAASPPRSRSENLPAALGTLDEPDLPAIPSVTGLPATVNRPPAGFAPPPRVSAPVPSASASKAPPSGGDFGEIDLPSPQVGLPATKQPLAFGGQAAGFGGKGVVDLPSAKRQAPGQFGAIDADLPALQNNLPMTAQNLPAVRGGGGGGGFGEIDLPSVANDLPAAQNNLPMTAATQGLLPQTAPNQGLLPSLGDFGELDLPRAQPMGMQLPTAQGPRAPSGGPPSSDGGFGELDLPGPDISPSGAPRPFGTGSGASAPPGMPPVSVPPHSAPPTSSDRRGGVGFGEVDLGGADAAPGTEMRLSGGLTPAVSSGTFAGEEVSSKETDLAKRRARTVVIKRSSVIPKLVAALLAVIVVGGALLQLTSVGAFGYLWIGDKLNSGEYMRAAAQGAEKARKRMGADTYSEARAAADELAQARARLPRSRPLSAYAALAQYMVDLRFGRDAQNDARANQWLNDIPPNVETKYTPVAQAAQAALAGDLPKARRLLEMAAKLASGDPLMLDVAFTRGEVELLAKDGPAAVLAFKKAAEISPTARAHFGLARGYDLSGDVNKAREEVNLALKASPNDAGALTLRAQLAWKRDRDDAAALKDLDLVTDGMAKATASIAEQARAHAIRGWVFVARDRPADARAAFDKALKLDGRSVLALVGQGEVLYQDGRFTEALARFDTAVQTDALSIEAIIGDAKTQIALERLADAKTQLTDTRAKFPKEMRIALWLGKAEEALGNKKPAEDQYLAAIDLADPSQPDAVAAYVALASLLASQGRAGEAEQKLEQARQKLPDSSTLQRAFGEIAAAQGQYERAVAFFEGCLQKDPHDVGTRFRLGVTLRRMRRMESAAGELDKVYAADKEYPGLALERGLLYEESGEVQKALEMFQGAMAKAPNDPDLQLRVGAAYVAIGRADDGIPLLNKVKDQRPNSPEAQHYLGRAYLQKGQLHLAQAMRYLKRAVELDPNRAEYHLYVGWAANEGGAGELGLARQEIEKALTIDRLLADGYWQLGVVERKQGAIDDAIRHLKRALELRPNRFEAHAALAECYGEKNDQAAALAAWKKAIDADDKRPFWRYRYGRIVFDRGNMAEAAKHLSAAAVAGEAETPRPGWINDAEFTAGEALRKVGKKAEAIERYNRYLQYAGSNAADSRDAMKALRELGAPYDSRGGL